MRIVHGMTKTPAKRGPSLATRILDHVAANKRRKFRCNELAAALGTDTQQTAAECGRLFRTGRITRERVEVPGRAQPITYYRWLRP